MAEEHTKHRVLSRWTAESREIEGLPSSAASVAVLTAFVGQPLTLDAVKAFCYAEAMSPIRSRVRMNVRVGEYICPPGGPHIPEALEVILTTAAERKWPSWSDHAAFLNLHPFVDGNGRTARAIYIWQAMRTPMGFTWLASRPLLQSLYYSALSDNDERIASKS